MISGDLCEIVKCKSITDIVIPCLRSELCSSKYIRWCENKFGKEWNKESVSNSWPQCFKSYKVNYETLKRIHLFELENDLIKYKYNNNIYFICFIM